MRGGLKLRPLLRLDHRPTPARNPKTGINCDSSLSKTHPRDSRPVIAPFTPSRLTITTAITHEREVESCNRTQLEEMKAHHNSLQNRCVTSSTVNKLFPRALALHRSVYLQLLLCISLRVHPKIKIMLLFIQLFEEYKLYVDMFDMLSITVRSFQCVSEDNSNKYQ